MATAVYPGSFDPFTKGHLDVVQRSCTMFDKIIIAIGNNSRKKFLFDKEERKELIETELQQLVPHIDNIEVCIFHNTLAKFIAENNIKIIVRGLRNHLDFVHELQTAQVNKIISGGCDTVFLASNHSFIASSIIKEIAGLHGDVTSFVSKNTAQALNKKLFK